jgi:DNA-binding HxlR family transcriptional regulator
MRSGAHALSLLAVPLNGTILEQLFEGPMRLADLHHDSGSAPQSTVRARLKGLEADQVMIKRTRKRSHGVADFVLTEAGHDLFVVTAALERWLLLAPEGPLAFGSAAGKSAIKALEGGWSSTMVGSLSSGSHTLGELARSISAVSYPSLDRRLTAMRRAGQVRACLGEGQGTPYEVTEWLQQGIAPLAAAVRWERTHFADDTAPITRLDTETAFLLALPLLRLELVLAGSCRMEVEINDEQGPLCGAVAQVEHGKVVSCTAGAQGPADSWAAGSISAWAQALNGDGADQLGLGGDKLLAVGLLDGLHGALFGAGTEGPPLT